jgi:hypothetical protein
MDNSGSGIAEPKFQDRAGTTGSATLGHGTAGPVIAGGSRIAGTANTQAGTAGVDPATGGVNTGTAAGSGTAGNTAHYQNFHQDNEPVIGAGNSTIFTTARYKNIKTQRQLRGEHTAICSGPTTDCYECGGMFVEGDNRTSRSVLLEDTKELIVSTNSYIKEDWLCISCKRSHPLLPLTSRKQEWSGGRKLIF